MTPSNSRNFSHPARPSEPAESSNPYRFSPDFIDYWEKLLTKIILIGFGSGAVLAGIGAILGSNFDGDIPEEDPIWNLVWVLVIAGGVVAALAILVPLLIGCILGGRAIHRHGWIAGVLTFIGMIALAAGWALDDELLGDWLDGWLTQAGLGVLVAGVLGFFLVGHLAKVPMSIGGVRVDAGARGDRQDSGGGSE